MAIVRAVNPKFKLFWQDVDLAESEKLRQGKYGTENRGGMLSFSEKQAIAKRYGLRWSDNGPSAIRI